MSSLFTNKNDKQAYFNQIKGTLKEVLGGGDLYTNIILDVGHENVRPVNLVVRKDEFERLFETQKIKVGEKLCVKFYLKSRINKNNFWNTLAVVLDVSRSE